MIPFFAFSRPCVFLLIFNFISRHLKLSVPSCNVKENKINRSNVTGDDSDESSHQPDADGAHVLGAAEDQELRVPAAGLRGAVAGAVRRRRRAADGERAAALAAAAPGRRRARARARARLHGQSVSSRAPKCEAWLPRTILHVRSKTFFLMINNYKYGLYISIIHRVESCQSRLPLKDRPPASHRGLKGRRRVW